MIDDVAGQIRREIKNREPSIRAFARRAGLPARSVQSYLDGKQPTVNRAAEICRALGLEFYIGPPREESPQDAGEAPAPVAIAQLLDLPAGASTEDAIQAIEDLRASGAGAQVLQEKIVSAVRIEIAANLNPDAQIPLRIREIDLVFPTMVFLAARPGGTATTREIVTHLEDRFRPSGEDAEALRGRGDSRFSQIVRNMISHRKDAGSFIRNGYAEYLSELRGLRVTDKGRGLLREMAGG